MQEKPCFQASFSEDSRDTPPSFGCFPDDDREAMEPPESDTQDRVDCPETDCVGVVLDGKPGGRIGAAPGILSATVCGMCGGIACGTELSRVACGVAARCFRLPILPDLVHRKPSMLAPETWGLARTALIFLIVALAPWSVHPLLSSS